MSEEITVNAIPVVSNHYVVNAFPVENAANIVVAAPIKSAAEVIAELNAIGGAYPKSKGGCLGMFQHTNQPIAERLMDLNANEIRSIDQLSIALYALYQDFKKEGTLLSQIHRCLDNSHAFPHVTDTTQSINEQKAYAVEHDDGGGSSMQWNLNDYKAAIQSLNGPFELDVLNTAGRH